jgi:hypothetical protein
MMSFCSPPHRAKWGAKRKARSWDFPVVDPSRGAGSEIDIGFDSYSPSASCLDVACLNELNSAQKPGIEAESQRLTTRRYIHKRLCIVFYRLQPRVKTRLALFGVAPTCFSCPASRASILLEGAWTF